MGDAPKKGHGRRSARQLIESEERAKYYRAKTAAAEAENAQRIGELVHPAVLEDALAKVVGEIAKSLDALPSQIKVDIPHLRAAEVQGIATRVARMRNALARIELWPAASPGS